MDNSHNYHPYRPLILDDPEDPYNPQPNNKESSLFVKIGGPVPWHVIRIHFRNFIRIVISLPLGAFIFCVFWALHTDFKRATTVLCVHDKNRPVRNYLPSVN
jgi:hypothetical protein